MHGRVLRGIDMSAVKSTMLAIKRSFCGSMHSA
jgi:hypothetical protein